MSCFASGLVSFQDYQFPYHGPIYTIPDYPNLRAFFQGQKLSQQLN